MDTILIVCDQLINFKRMPKELLDILPGYQAFSKIGIQFQNIYNNRQDCSPSRASLMSSKVNIGICDNIDFKFQYESVPSLNENLMTIGKVMKKNNIDTAYYGKQHIDSKIATDDFVDPAFNTNTRKCMKKYGFDIYSTFGDVYYYANEGIFGDNITMEFKINNSNTEYDYEDSTGKYVGVIPYLKSKLSKTSTPRNRYHLQVHFENPHDTQHFWQNFAEVATSPQLQFHAPYIEKQIELINAQNPSANVKNPFLFDKEALYISNPELMTNFFESTFEEYCSNINSLPFLQSYKDDYCYDPKLNSIFPLFIGLMEMIKSTITSPNDQNDLKSWKNLVNNYYGLVIMTDLYIFQIYKFLEENKLLDETCVAIISDHGDLMSAHGMKQKGVHFDEGTNIACLIYSPKIAPENRGTESTVIGSLLDISPTLEVLAGLESHSPSFLGTPLLVSKGKSDCPLVPRTENKPVINVYNSWLTFSSYFFYQNWFSNSDTSTQDRVISQNNVFPDFYNYLGFYLMTVDEINGKIWKLARYFNFSEILLFNYEFNPLYKDVVLSDLFGYCDYFSEKVPLFKHDVSIFNTFVLLNGKVKASDSLNLHEIQKNPILKLLLVNALSKKLQDNNYRVLVLLPGYYISSKEKSNLKSNLYGDIPNSFNDYYNDPDTNYYYFLHNITDDPYETINLLDKNFNRANQGVLDIASELNDKINMLIEEYDMVNFEINIPENMFLSIFINYKMSGVDTSKYSKEELKNLTSCFGQIKLDYDKHIHDYSDNVIALLNGKGKLIAFKNNQ